MRVFGDRANAIAIAVDKLEEARDAGVDTVVDVTPFDVERDIRFGEEVSRKSGMQIVACTGQHFFAPESFNERTVEEITEIFIREIERGIEATDIKAGVIKVAARSGRVDCIKQLVDAGFVDRLFLSNVWVFGDVEREKVNPDGLLYTTRKTIPYLKQIGVSPREIPAITVENPKRFFSRIQDRESTRITGSRPGPARLRCHCAD